MDRNANVFKFQGSKMIVSGKGPNFTMDTSFRPNLLSSTMNMPRNFEKHSSAASVTSSQRSIYHRRDISPSASVRSDLQPRNFHQPFYSRGYFQKSVYNDRAVSPVSMRSIDSTASRADIVIDAIKSCTEDEWEKIWHAVNRKHEFRKKAQKRRKMKAFLKNVRNRTDDEGEQGSHSSISNDDCMSTQTGYSRRYRYDPYSKENVPRSVHSYDCRSEDMYRGSIRNVYSGYVRSDPQNPYQIDNNSLHPEKMFSYQQQRFGGMHFSQKNCLPLNESTLYSQNNTMCGPKNTFFPQRNTNFLGNFPSIQRNTLNASICSTKSMQNMPMMSQRERFRGGFQFPSQKFNKSKLNEEQEQVGNKQYPKKDCANKMNNIDKDQIDDQSDENDNIFLDKTVKAKTVTKKSEKRKAESLDDTSNPKKKPKTATSNDKVKTNKQQTQSKDNNQNTDFQFIKPQCPVRKSAPIKPYEKIISKSSTSSDLLSTIENKNPQPQTVQVSSLDSEPDTELEPQEIPELTTSDLSMRPSFMKRKLFTQTLDVTEKKNNSFDSGHADSPQNNIYSALVKEKHKTRKLASSQSLLSRDVNQDDENLLDLIHKIVPANQVNSTITNNNKTRISRTKNDDDKWDITSIISTCNNDSVSETYTDDEIFKTGNDDTKTESHVKPENKKIKQNYKNKAANKSVHRTTNNDKKSKDGNINPVSNKNVSHKNNDSAKYVVNTKTTNNKNIEEMDKIKETNNKIVNDVVDINQISNKIVKDVVDIKQANSKIVKDVDSKQANNKILKDVDIKQANNKDAGNSGNITTQSKKIKEIGKIKLTCTNIVKDIANVNPSNMKSRDVSKNPLNDKMSKELNRYVENSKYDKGMAKKILPPTPNIDTPVKCCPAKRVMLSRSRIDAFWDTDESDYECAGARRDQTIQQHTDLAEIKKSNPKGNGPVTQPTLSSKEFLTNKNLALSPLVVLHDVKKIPKKQASKQTETNTQMKTLKKSDDTTHPQNLGKTKTGTPNTSLRTRRQVNRSGILDSVNKSDPKDEGSALKHIAATKIVVQKKQKTEKKTQLDKFNKTAEISKSRNKKQNKSQIDDSKKQVEKPRRHSQKSKLHNCCDDVKIDICKVLRSRNIDLSSSFNSDKFELTMSRTRKTRTPSKRISFNKSKDVPINNKIRNRAIKS